MSDEKQIGYDIIGDVHGYADKLEGLLLKMDYELIDGTWQHPERKVIFVGDLIDRHHRTVVLDHHGIEDAGVGAAGADLGEVGPQGLDGLGHAILGILLDVS